MTRRRIAAGAVLGALALGVLAYATLSGDAAPAPSPSDRRDAPLRAEAHVVREEPIAETVRTVGTLVANESVEIVAELSRRLVAVDVAEGAQVKAGDRLFKLDDADLRAQLAELEARHQLASSTVRRQRELLAFEKRALSQQAYDQATADLQAASAEIASLQVTIAKTEIRAPFAGRIGLRRVSEGAWVTPSTVLTTLQDTSRIKVDFTLPERHAGAIAIGQPFQFRVAGRAEDFAGEVIAIEPAIDAGTRSLLVRGTSDNPGGSLMPGAFVTLDVPVAAERAGIRVPAQAVVPSLSGHAVYVLEDGVAQLREIEIGVRTAESVQVTRGLAPGDTVLTTNLLRMRPGARVEVETARAAARAADG
jgi:membrane fusion protein (multidrug efflux system)